jgi:PleD family two-component response regulator
MRAMVPWYTFLMQKPSILIVDDDSFLLDMYALKFTQSGFDVHSALGGTVAFQKIKEGLAPDILLTDIVMPVMDGFELLQKVQSENLAPKTVKVVISNLGQSCDVDKAKGFGATEYIVKANATPSEVVAKVLSVIGRKA